MHIASINLNVVFKSMQLNFGSYYCKELFSLTHWMCTEELRIKMTFKKLVILFFELHSLLKPATHTYF